jgi:hypothetical protein
MTDPLLQYLRLLPDDERQRLYLDRYNEAASAGELFGVSAEDVRQACKEIGKEAGGSRRWLFLWLAGINRAHGAGRISVKGFKVGVGLFGFANTASRYAWPNQMLLAECAGWSTQNRRGVFEGLRELEEDLGAIRRLRFIDLPLEVIQEANRAARRKPKDPRSAAYFFHSVELWKKDDLYPLGKHTSVSPGEALNTHTQLSPASPDSSHSYVGDSSSASRLVDMSLLGDDKGRDYG